MYICIHACIYICIYTHIPVQLDQKKPKIKLYKDEEGNIKGDARIGFLKAASVPLVLQLAEGMLFREDPPGCPIQVSAALCC